MENGTQLGFFDVSKNPPEFIAQPNGVKEDNGKLYYELDWSFIEDMAKRMSLNKEKYPPWNWKKPIEIESIRQAIARHFIEIMKGNYDDEGIDHGHIIALACNAMILKYQLENGNTY